MLSANVAKFYSIALLYTLNARSEFSQGGEVTMGSTEGVSVHVSLPSPLHIPQFLLSLS